MLIPSTLPTGPTALGLTTTLLTLKLNRQQIQKRLLIFSLSAPLGAIVTYGIVSLFGGNSGGKQPSAHELDKLGWWTGIVLLFSVSTLERIALFRDGEFPLYIAVNIHMANKYCSHYLPPSPPPLPSIVLAVTLLFSVGWLIPLCRDRHLAIIFI